MGSSWVSPFPHTSYSDSELMYAPGEVYHVNALEFAVMVCVVLRAAVDVWMFIIYLEWRRIMYKWIVIIVKESLVNLETNILLFV